MSAQSIRKRIFMGTAVYGLGSMLINAMAVLLVPIYTRVLSPEQYGILAGANITQQVVGIFMGLGLAGAMMRFHFDQPDLAAKRNLHGSLYLAHLGWAAALLLVLWLIGPVFMDGLFRGIRFDPYLKLALIIAFGHAAFAFPLVIYQAEQQPHKHLVLTIGSFLLTVSLVLWFVVGLGQQALGSLRGQAIAGVVLLVVSLYVMGRRIDFKISRTTLAAALAYSLPMLVYALGGLITQLSSRFFVERNTDLLTLGLFNTALKYSLLLSSVFLAVNMAWVPIFFETAPRDEGHRNYARFVQWLLSGAMLLALAMSLLAKEIFAVFTGSAFHPAAQFVPLLTLAAAGSTACWTALVNPLFLLKKTKPMVWFTLSAGTASVLLNMTLVPRWGAHGAALADFLSVTLLNLMAYFACRRLYPAPYQWKKLGALALLALGLYTAGIKAAPALGNWGGPAFKLAMILFFAGALLPAKIVRKEDWTRFKGWALRMAGR